MRSQKGEVWSTIMLLPLDEVSRERAARHRMLWPVFVVHIV